MTKIWEDPIVTEVRHIREELLKKAGGLDQLVRLLQRKEKEQAHLVVVDRAKQS